MINRASDAVNKMSVKMNESDNWFESKLQEVENEEQLLRKLHAAVDSFVNHRKELCSNTAVFNKSLAILGSVEENSALSHALSQLAEVEDKMEQLHQQQTFSDFFILAELLAYYVRLLAAVRCCSEQRMKVCQHLQEAQSTLQKKREAEAKLLWENKSEKLQQAKDNINEVKLLKIGKMLNDNMNGVSAQWESKVSQYERDFERVTCTVRKEVLRFEVRCVSHMFIMMMNFIIEKCPVYYFSI
ncbi:sorting nexin-1 [Carassius gibelio]|uniref:sorting nexin-1 n=1 Tax=Carassius gibelio TaxID=101364 RepID=UPI0022792B12|nr:sorting nexin-1 [Carassius gibelio]XP_052457563.1 sorting nexin-1 [Carassius gibelio]XP_052457564.1 sorting nexin-1 [Carassius gibelio]